ncbi:MAG: TolC family protein [Phycisphaeraceae bacterium]|nr:MAG: TolC family protein [Phycisphaeraceae bacterium]
MNPSASSLTYEPADEARDVAARLDAYTRRELGGDEGREAVELDLAGALREAQRAGREYLSAQEDYLIAAIGLLVERHLWSPRFFNDTFVGIAGAGDQGRFEHALSIINTLRATQRLPFGGEVEARWITRATDQLRQQATGYYVQSSELGISGNVPLLRGAGDVAREGLISAERNLVYQAREFERFRRQYLVSVSTDYFALIQTQARITNQERQLASLETFRRGTSERVAAGRIREFERAIADNEVLSATAALAGLRESYILQLDRFKVRLGMSPDRPLVIRPIGFDLPEPEADPAAAATLALDLRLDVQNARDRVDDARRAVANARNGLLPDLNVTAGVSVPTSGGTDVGGYGFDPDDTRYQAGLTLSLPLDRTIETLALRRSLIDLERQGRAFERRRDETVVEVRGALRNVELARFQLTLAERAVEINQRRLEEQQLRIDQVEPQKVVDSENALLNAENARDQATTTLRVAILEYLLATDQLRVAEDGSFEPLPGMVRRQAPAP